MIEPEYEKDEAKKNESRLPQKKKKESPSEEPQCGICFEKPTVEGSLDSCMHKFCFLCIKQWSKTANTCPFCNKRFKSITKFNPLSPKEKKVTKVRHRNQRVAYDDSQDWMVSEEEFDLDNPFLAEEEEEVFSFEVPPYMLQFLSPQHYEEFVESSEELIFEPEIVDLTEEEGSLPEEEEEEEEVEVVETTSSNRRSTRPRNRRSGNSHQSRDNHSSHRDRVNQVEISTSVRRRSVVSSRHTEQRSASTRQRRSRN